MLEKTPLAAITATIASTTMMAITIAHCVREDMVLHVPRPYSE